MKLLIRADKNEIVASGHVQRCLSVADAFRALGGEVTFVSADRGAVDTVTGRGYECIVLDTDWQDLEGEIPSLTAVLQDCQPDLLLVDSYRATARYLEQVNALVPVVWMDDLMEMTPRVRAIVNYEIYADKNAYGAANPGTAFLPGPSYAPLRKAFENLPAPEIRAFPDRLLLMCGGSMPYDILGRLTAIALAEGWQDITVLCGNHPDLKADLEKRFAGHEGLRFLDFVEDMPALYARTDLAVSAAGSTLYELAAAGVPAVCYTLADNQIQNAAAFEGHDLMDCAGSAAIPGEVEDRLPALLKKNTDPDLRARRSKALRETIDGRGAERLARALRDLI
jgi:spore coat polysaccharide biosynthesis predicted glycosyltransferase SpsG